MISDIAKLGTRICLTLKEVANAMSQLENAQMAMCGDMVRMGDVRKGTPAHARMR
jgi:hypothetical protein